jgi:predicted flap endonuclease-1-like 5' DNA nuclease
VPALGAVAAQSTVVTTGEITFDKEVTYKTVDILGVGPAYEAKLKALGITKVEQLLLEGSTATDRKHMAEATGISEKLILTWVNHCDLMRVTGCGPEYARLMERAGVDTVVELAGRNSFSLAAKLKAANDLGGGKVCVKRLPDVVTATKWINNAAQFRRVVSYYAIPTRASPKGGALFQIW